MFRKIEIKSGPNKLRADANAKTMKGGRDDREGADNPVDGSFV